MYLVAVPWEEAWKCQGPTVFFLSWAWLSDNLMIMQVPSMSNPQVGVGGEVVWPWNPCPDMVLLIHGFELSAFDMQNWESRAKLPFKCSFWRVHCRCNGASQVKIFIRAKLASVACLLGGMFEASSHSCYVTLLKVPRLYALQQYKKENALAEMLSKLCHLPWPKAACPFPS